MKTNITFRVLADHRTCSKIGKELPEPINSMANVECHEVAPTAELKSLADVVGAAMRKKRGGEL